MISSAIFMSWHPQYDRVISPFSEYDLSELEKSLREIRICAPIKILHYSEQWDKNLDGVLFNASSETTNEHELFETINRDFSNAALQNTSKPNLGKYAFWQTDSDKELRLLAPFFEIIETYGKENQREKYITIATKKLLELKRTKLEAYESEQNKKIETLIKKIESDSKL